MGAFKYLDAILENKMSGIHTAYLAKVLSVSGDTAKIQPLGLYQNADGTTKKQSVLTKVPIAGNVRHFSMVTERVADENVEHIKIEALKAGDIVVCICCEQNISEAKRGVNALPPAGRFSMSDSIIIGVL